jgi:hypothetical protein
MSIIVEWDNEQQTILCLRYEARWNWDDFNLAAKQMTLMLDAVSHPVDLVFDVRSGAFPPPGAMSRFRSIMDNPHPGVRHLVFVAPSLVCSFVQGLIRLMSSLYGSSFTPPNFEFATSMEEARRLLLDKLSLLTPTPTPAPVSNP